MNKSPTVIASRRAFTESLKSLISLEPGSPVALDIETTGLDCFTDRIILIQIATETDINIYDVRELPESLIIHLVNLLENKKIIAHNAKFDLKFIYEKYGTLFKNVYDTQTLEAVANAGMGHGSYPSYKHKWRYSLNDILNEYTPYEIPKDTRKDFVDNYKIILTEKHIQYAASDVKFLHEVREKQLEKLGRRNLLKVADLEMKLLPVIVDMEHEGIDFNKDKWSELYKISMQKLEDKREELESYVSNVLEEHINKFKNAKEALDYFDVTHKKTIKYTTKLEEATTIEEIKKYFWDNFNFNSTYQLQRVLNADGIPVESTNAKYLKQRFGNEELVQLVLDYREWSKKADTFGENFFKHINPVTKRIHSDFNQMGAGTGRKSSSEPNLQNIIADSEYRHCFVAEEGYSLLSADYSQVELRMAAHVSQDEVMIDAFNSGKDLHAITGENVFGVLVDEQDEKLRTKAKSLNFSMLYKTTHKGISYNFQIPESEAKELLENFNNTYKGLSAFMNAADDKIWSSGYAITPFGRKRFFVIPNEWYDSRGMWRYKYRVLREGFNHIIQGGCADIIKLAMVDIWHNNPFGNKLKILLQVHDEIVVKIHNSVLEDGTEFVINKMRKAGERLITSVPVKVDKKVKPYWEK